MRRPTDPAKMDDVVAVATSGGRDSIALLHATVAASAPLGLRVAALHVHHGLQEAADQWLEGVRSLCLRWADEGCPVTFASVRLEGRPARGESVESWARRERYAALARLAREAGATLVLLAHHRRDQAETVLLQALRGAGPAGLAAMPKTIVRDGLTWARPWLEVTAEDIDAYARRHALPYVVDPSNEDARWARSRLRTRVMPALREAFPDAEGSLAASARRAHEAREVLDEIAREDLARLVDATGLGLDDWRRLSASRRANALRAWLAASAPGGVPETLIARLVDELVDDAPRWWPLGDGRRARSWRGRLAVVMGGSGGGRRAGVDVGLGEVVGEAEAEAGGEAGGEAGSEAGGEAGGGAGSEAGGEAGGGAVSEPGGKASGEAGSEVGGEASSRGASVDLRLLRCGLHEVPGWPGRLEVFAVEAHGIAPSRLAHVRARARAGGEQFRRGPRATDRSLKKQFQAAGVPQEERDGPLVFDAQGALLFVPGLGVDARAWAPAGVPQWSLRWVRADGMRGESGSGEGA